MRRIPWKFLLATIVLGLIFVDFPGLDLGVSSLFYHQGIFSGDHSDWAESVYRTVPRLATLYMLIVLAALTYLAVRRRNRFLGLDRKAYIYLLLAFLLGPGLMVNTLLKGYVGRARPIEVIQFGGDKIFTPAFVLSDQTKPNGSFVCGHASVGFSLVSLEFLFARRRKYWRRWLLGTSLIVGGVIGLGRIAQGGHFLSDVIFSFVFVYLVSYLLHALMFRREGPAEEVA